MDSSTGDSIYIEDSQQFGPRLVIKITLWGALVTDILGFLFLCLVLSFALRLCYCFAVRKYEAYHRGLIAAYTEKVGLRLIGKGSLSEGAKGIFYFVVRQAGKTETYKVVLPTGEKDKPDEVPELTQVVSKI